MPNDKPISDHTPTEREWELAKFPANCARERARTLAEYRQELLSDPAVVMEAAERILREAGVTTARIDGPPHDYSDFVELWTMREWDPDNLRRGVNAFDGDGLAAAFAALVQARTESSREGGG